MFVVAIFTVLIALCAAAPMESMVQPLTEEQVERIANWTPEEQNAWQLSGQFQGDIVLSPNQRNGMVDKRYRWPKATLVYQFDRAVTSQQRQLIKNSLNDYSKYTCVRHKERTNEKDYIYVTNVNSGCWSYVGRNGGRQQLNLQANGCMYKGTIIHEFKHALGFWHQQSATERDRYVTIQWANIKSGAEHNFNKYGSNIITSFGTPYDYGSIMHYDAYAFSKNGKKTIVTKGGQHIGQSNGLSSIDITKVKKMYC